MDSKIFKENNGLVKLDLFWLSGSAVGLGNLWGFAYRASQGGGAAFVLLYILIVLLVCLPAFVAEMALGRNAMTSTLIAPSKLAGKNYIIRYSFFHSSWVSLHIIQYWWLDSGYFISLIIFWTTQKFN